MSGNSKQTSLKKGKRSKSCAAEAFFSDDEVNIMYSRFLEKRQSACTLKEQKHNLTFALPNEG